MESPKTIMIDDVKYVRADAAQQHEMDDEGVVIVRSSEAGVFCGKLVSSDLANGVVEMKNARRIWQWAGAATLSQLATDGTSKPNECKFPTPVRSISITKVIEVIPCTKKAVESINSVPVWKA